MGILPGTIVLLSHQNYCSEYHSVYGCFSLPPTVASKDLLAVFHSATGIDLHDRPKMSTHILPLEEILRDCPGPSTLISVPETAILPSRLISNANSTDGTDAGALRPVKELLPLPRWQQELGEATKTLRANTEQSHGIHAVGIESIGAFKERGLDFMQAMWSKLSPAKPTAGALDLCNIMTTAKDEFPEREKVGDWFGRDDFHIFLCHGTLHQSQVFPAPAGSALMDLPIPNRVEAWKIIQSAWYDRRGHWRKRLLPVYGVKSIELVNVRCLFSSFLC
jgi:hypothetical protein